MKTTFNVLIILILCMALSFEKSEGLLVPITPNNSLNDTIPFSKINELKDSDLCNNIYYEKNKPLIVIYTFLGCKPCLVLERKLIKKCEKGKLNPLQVIYVNSIVFDSNKVKEHIQKENILSPYYILKEKHFEGSYPKIAAYDSSGNIQWIKYGFDFRLIDDIKVFLNTKKSD